MLAAQREDNRHLTRAGIFPASWRQKKSCDFSRLAWRTGTAFLLSLVFFTASPLSRALPTTLPAALPAALPERTGENITEHAVHIGWAGGTAMLCLLLLRKRRGLQRAKSALAKEKTHGQALSHQVQELAALSEVTQTVHAALDTAAVMEKILDVALQLLQASTGTVMLVDPLCQVLRATASRHTDHTPGIFSHNVVFGEGVHGWVAQHRTPLLLRRAYDTDLFRRLISKDSSVQSVLCVPLVHRGELLGVLTVWETRKANTFHKHDLHALGLFAEKAAVAVANARSFQKQQENIWRLEEARQQYSELITRTSQELRADLVAVSATIHALGAPQDRGEKEQTTTSHTAKSPEEAAHFQSISLQIEHALHLTDDLLWASSVHASPPTGVIGSPSLITPEGSPSPTTPERVTATTPAQGQRQGREQLGRKPGHTQGQAQQEDDEDNALSTRYNPITSPPSSSRVSTTGVIPAPERRSTKPSSGTSWSQSPR